jgi:hypothetical protein
MQIQQANWTSGEQWRIDPLYGWGNAQPDYQTSSPKIQQKTQPQGSDFKPQLVLVFGNTDVLKTINPIQQLRQLYPQAYLMGCSTAGEIYDVQVRDHSITATAIEFATTQVISHHIYLHPLETSCSAGARLAKQFPMVDLAHLFVLSDGLRVNGSELIAGLRSELPDAVTITGGLSGDGSRFGETLVLSNTELGQGMIAAVGFYGTNLKVGYGSIGGWTAFGPKRTVTKSEGNVLYELDGQSALALYKKYLGEYASDLPASGLLFPLNLYNKEGDTAVVRTILAVDETEQNLTFAGDLPEGSIVQLMQANFNRLIDGAMAAAQNSLVTSHDLADSSVTESIAESPPKDSKKLPELAILISCVGRKLVLKQRIEEEVEGVREVIGSDTVLTGFYSYGEIAPSAQGKCCELHNQTMTITTFTES